MKRVIDKPGFAKDFGVAKSRDKYKLYGICCQSGELYGGHYYAMCYNKYDTQSIVKL